MLIKCVHIRKGLRIASASVSVCCDDDNSSDLVETCNVSCNQQFSGLESSIGTQGTVWVFSLLTSRMTFLEDSNVDPAPEADTEKGSCSAMEGACPDAPAQQREAAACLLKVLADLDQAHEEFQQQEQGKVAPGSFRP